MAALSPHARLGPSNGVTLCATVKLYLCAIGDVYSNRIVGYSIDSRNEVLTRGGRARPRSVAVITGRTIVHSGRGSQFRSRSMSKQSAILSQRCTQGSEMPKSFAIWRADAPHPCGLRRHWLGTCRKRFRDGVDPSSKDESSQVRSQPNRGRFPYLHLGRIRHSLLTIATRSEEHELLVAVIPTRPDQP